MKQETIKTIVFMLVEDKTIGHLHSYKKIKHDKTEKKN